MCPGGGCRPPGVLPRATLGVFSRFLFFEIAPLSLCFRLAFSVWLSRSQVVLNVFFDHMSLSVFRLHTQWPCRRAICSRGFFEVTRVTRCGSTLDTSETLGLFHAVFEVTRVTPMWFRIIYE